MPEGIKALDELRLREAFSRTYKPFDECWTVSMDSTLLVIDDDQTHFTRFSNDPDDEGRALMVINKANKQIILLSIDNKLIANRKGGITDGALFDEEQFHFIEFKTNALGNSYEAIIDTFDTAVGQLKETVSVFVKKLKLFDVDLLDSREVSCRIVVSNRFPRSRAIRQNYSLQFFDDTGVELNFSEKMYWERR